MTLAEAETAPADVVAAAPADWQGFCAERRAWAWRLARRLLGWRGDPDDAVQEAFLRAFAKRHTLRDPAKAQAWLGALVANACRTQQRQAALRRKLLGWMRPAEAAPPPSMDGDEIAAEIRIAVAALPPTDRSAIVLRYFEDWSVAQIAEALGMRKNAAEVRLHRARAKLASALGHLREDA